MFTVVMKGQEEETIHKNYLIAANKRLPQSYPKQYSVITAFCLENHFQPACNTDISLLPAEAAIILRE